MAYKDPADGRAAAARRRLVDVEQYRAGQRAKYLRAIATPEGTAKIRLRECRYRAANKGIPFDLDLNWIISKMSSGRCEVTGLPFSFTGDRSPFGPSIDQKVPGGGYTKDNCQIVVLAYNMAKGCGTHEDVMTLCRALTYPQAH